ARLGRVGHGGLVVAHDGRVGPLLVQRDQVLVQVAGAAELAAEQVPTGTVARRELVVAGRPDVRVGLGAEAVLGRRFDHGGVDGGRDAAALAGAGVDVAVVDLAAQLADGDAVVPATGTL